MFSKSFYPQSEIEAGLSEEIRMSKL